MTIMKMIITILTILTIMKMIITILTIMTIMKITINNTHNYDSNENDNNNNDNDNNNTDNDTDNNNNDNGSLDKSGGARSSKFLCRRGVCEPLRRTKPSCAGRASKILGTRPMPRAPSIYTHPEVDRTWGIQSIHSMVLLNHTILFTPGWL